MSLTREEVDQFEREGWVMKRKVLSRGDMEPIQKELTEIVHREALALQEKGMLDEIYEDKPFETRLASDSLRQPQGVSGHLSKHHGKGWRRLQRRGDVPLREASTAAFLYRKPSGTRYHRRLNLSRPSKVAGVGARRGTLASGFGLFHASLRQIPHINLLDSSGRCHPRKRVSLCIARTAYTGSETPLYGGDTRAILRCREIYSVRLNRYPLKWRFQRGERSFLDEPNPARLL